MVKSSHQKTQKPREVKVAKKKRLKKHKTRKIHSRKLVADCKSKCSVEIKKVSCQDEPFFNPQKHQKGADA
jgi:hypothetical protein